MPDSEAATLIATFGQAWADHDLDAAMALMTDDCIFDNTDPAPDGTRCVGRAAVRAAWQGIFDDPGSRFTEEELVILGDRAVQRWRYDWAGGHVRGIDLFRLRDGLIAEKLSYVKG